MIHFNSKVNILHVDAVKDSMGSYNEVESVLYENLPCRINWSRGSERIQFDKTTYYRDAKLYCRVIAVTVEERVSYNGTTYEIVNVSDVDNVGKYMILEIKLIQ